MLLVWTVTLVAGLAMFIRGVCSLRRLSAEVMSTPLPEPPRMVPGRYCQKCEYDLIGLSPEGVCPECGEQIVDQVVISEPSPVWQRLRQKTDVAWSLLVCWGLVGGAGFIGLIFFLITTVGHDPRFRDDVIRVKTGSWVAVLESAYVLVPAFAAGLVVLFAFLSNPFRASRRIEESKRIENPLGLPFVPIRRKLKCKPMDA